MANSFLLVKNANQTPLCVRSHECGRPQAQFPWVLLSLVPMMLLFVLAGAPPAKAQGDCKSLYDADDKMLATDHRTFSTHSSPNRPGNPETAESVMVDGVTYLKVKGVWHKSQMTLAQIREQKAENRKNAKSISCRYVRDESVNGEVARVFNVHSEDEDSKSDMTVWISKNRGLLLRVEQDNDAGATAAEKMHQSTRYEYTNVSAPPVS